MAFRATGWGSGADDAAVYRDTAARNARELVPLIRRSDIVLLHDPQTAGLVEPVRACGAHVVWRCHVGIDSADEFARAAWEFLLPHVQLADAVVFSRRAYVWEGLDEARVSVIPPSIDAFSAKNQALPLRPRRRGMPSASPTKVPSRAPAAASLASRATVTAGNLRRVEGTPHGLRPRIARVPDLSPGGSSPVLQSAGPDARCSVVEAAERRERSAVEPARCARRSAPARPLRA